MVEQNEGVSKNLSLRKALDILEVLVNYKDGGARLQDIAKDLKMSPSTVFRFLNTFIDYDYINQDLTTSKYYLTLKLADLGDRNRKNYPIQQTLRKYIKEIVETFNESSSVCIESNMQMVYIATEDGQNRMLQTLTKIGRIAPMYATGVGKLHLAQYTEKQLMQYAEKNELKKITDNTYTSIEMLKEELKSIRNQGFSFDNEECEIGIKCIAVPVRDYTGKIVAAISLSAPISRLNANKTMEIILFLKQISKQASKELGWKDLNE